MEMKIQLVMYRIFRKKPFTFAKGISTISESPLENSIEGLQQADQVVKGGGRKYPVQISPGRKRSPTTPIVELPKSGDFGLRNEVFYFFSVFFVRSVVSSIFLRRRFHNGAISLRM